MSDDDLRARLDDVERDLTGANDSQIEQWKQVLRGELSFEEYVERHGGDVEAVRDWRRP